jgi:hypothetical protein
MALFGTVTLILPSQPNAGLTASMGLIVAKPRGRRGGEYPLAFPFGSAPAGCRTKAIASFLTVYLCFLQLP